MLEIKEMLFFIFKDSFSFKIYREIRVFYLEN